MGNIEDITDGIPQESQDAPAPVEAPPQEEATVETLPYRVKDTERQLRADALQAIAEDMGYDNPAAVINQLRNGQEAAEIYREAREMFKRSRAQTPPPQPDAYYQEQEARRAQQYQRPAQPQYRQPEPAEDDPLALIRGMNQRLSEMDQRTARMDEFYQWQRQQAERDFYEREQSLRQEANHEYTKFAGELKKAGVPEHKIPDREYLLEEAESMGMFGGRLPVGDIYRRTYKMLYGDDIAQEAAAAALQAARSPKARVTVSTGKQVTPPQAPSGNSIEGMREALGGLRFSEVDLPTERR